MMNYNELLNKMYGRMASASKAAAARKAQASNVSTPKEDTISTLLNKIGLEVQRQGG